MADIGYGRGLVDSWWNVYMTTVGVLMACTHAHTHTLTLSLSLSLSLSIFNTLTNTNCLCLSVPVSVSLCLCLPVSPSLSVCLSVSLSVSVCLSVCLSVSVFLSLSLSLSFSIPLPSFSLPVSSPPPPPLSLTDTEHDKWVNIRAVAGVLSVHSSERCQIASDELCCTLANLQRRVSVHFWWCSGVCDARPGGYSNSQYNDSCWLGQLVW